MKPAIQPNLERRFQIAITGFMIPFSILMLCHILNIKISDDFRQLCNLVSTSFSGMLGLEELLLLYNIFFINPFEDEPIKVSDSSTTFKPKNRAGYVYLLSAIHDKTLYKIGRTNNPENRLRTFNVKLPFPIEYEHLIKTNDMYRLENILHNRFASKRLEGEFFRLSEEDVAYIKDLSNG